MDHHEHEELIAGIQAQFNRILAESEQGIYIYLDDVHKTCNRQFAEMMGYDSAENWSKAQVSFTGTFVDEQSQQALVSHYMQAMQHMAAGAFEVNWKTKSGGSLKTFVILAPISYQGALMAIHFVTPV
jgi:PAS domain-containing protein